MQLKTIDFIINHLAKFRVLIIFGSANIFNLISSGGMKNEAIEYIINNLCFAVD